MADEVIIWSINIRVQVSLLKIDSIQNKVQHIHKSARKTFWVVRDELRGTAYSGPEKLIYIKVVRDRMVWMGKEIDTVMADLPISSPHRAQLVDANHFICMTEVYFRIHEPKIQVEIKGLGNVNKKN